MVFGCCYLTLSGVGVSGVFLSDAQNIKTLLLSQKSKIGLQQKGLKMLFFKILAASFALSYTATIVTLYFFAPILLAEPLWLAPLLSGKFVALGFLCMLFPTVWCCHYLLLKRLHSRR